MAFQVIRISLLVGVLLIAGSLWYVVQQLGGPLFDADMQATLQVPVIGLFAAITLGVLFIQKKRAETDELKKKRSLTIVGWAMAESLAIVGALYYLFVGSLAFLLVGILLQIGVSFYYLPIPPGAAASS